MENMLPKLTRKNIWDTIQSELNKPQNGRGQVLVLHLFCEWFMNQLYSNLLKKSLHKVEKMSFDDKRKVLFKNKVLDNTLNEDLIILNKIRNLLGHKLRPDKSELIDLLKKHSNYWAENIMKELGTYGKIRFVTIETVSKMLDIYWKQIIRPILDKIKNSDN